MSIASEIIRLQTAKASIKASIEAQGVTVPSTATLDDYPDLIDAISGGGGGAGLWTQKQVTVQSAISLGDGFSNLISNNIPSGVTFAIIINDSMDSSTYINNQLVSGVYDSANSLNNMFIRYRDGNYAVQSGGYGIWSNTYALTASQNDSYTLFYK